MTEIGEHPKEKMDIFVIGLYAMEAIVIIAIIYAMIVLPAYLIPAT
jgi:hypothetical protein